MVPRQPGGTYLISLLNNEYILNHDLKLFIYSILNQREGLMKIQLSAVELTKSKWGLFSVNFIETHSTFQELKISFLSWLFGITYCHLFQTLKDMI